MTVFALSCIARRREPAAALLVFLAIASPSSSLQAQRRGRGGNDSSAAAMKWREIGPYRGGRSAAVTGSPSRPNEYYMGTTGGGVFKTADGGISWTPITDKFFGGTIGAIAMSESNPDIVYVGAGEYDIRGNVSHGDGVWKSTDAGKTWAQMGLAETRQIARVRVHPTNPDIVYVGALGHVWAPNADRGIFKTVDGGKTWTKILFRNDSTGITDLIMDPTNPEVLYAAFWQAGRRPWTLISGGAGSGIFKTTNGGATWTELTRNQGLPTGVIGNIGLTISPANPNRLWALIEADSGGVFRSDDAGKTWTRTNSERKLRQRAWYYTRIFADPKDTGSVYALNTGFYRSTDGGKTFKGIPVPHGDNHDLWIAPNDAKRMIEANDGGANVSFDGGKNWSDEDFATAQFYHVTTTNDFPYQVCGAQQDNSTVCIKSRANGGIGMGDWEPVGGGESGYIAVKPDSPWVVYAGSYGGLTTRLNRRTGIESDVNPWPDNPMGHSAEDLKYRFQWTFPILISPHNTNTLYVASNVLFRSTNGGQSFSPISPDLTRHDPTTLGPSGGPITKDQTSVEYYATIFTVAESPVKAGVIWTGSDDGFVSLSIDGGRSWKKVTPKDLPEWTRISIIEASPFSPGTAYIAGNRYQLDDMAPYLYRTTDYGKSWTKIVSGIPATEFTRVIREDPARKGLLYAGTERSVYVSYDDGGNWEALRLNLPLVPVHDLAVKEGDLVAATHGRSFWILDDLSPLRQHAVDLEGKNHLFKPRDLNRAGFFGSGAAGTGAHPVGANPPSGAVIYYQLAKANQEVTLEFLDGAGKQIRKFTSNQDSATAADSVRGDSVQRVRRDSLAKAGVSADSAKKLEQRGEETPQQFDEEGPRRAPRPPRVRNKAGLNTFTWDMAYPDASSFNNIIMWAGGTRGPVAPPGTYSVRMTVTGDSSRGTQSQSFILKKDPRSRATAEGLQAQFALLLQIRDRLSQANDAVKTVRNVRAQLRDRGTRAGATATQLAQESRGFLDRLAAIEGEIYQVKNQSGQDPLNYPIKLNNRIAALAGVVGGADGRPTAQSYAVFRELSGLLDAQLGKLKSEMSGSLPKVNALLRQANLPEITPSTAEPEEKPGVVASSMR
ncbi:MAG: glycosyl hydrolase [Gemmatimonadota bacterium]|nr:glycosyl hydrolase [Gemmatimonadota bacterium]